MGTAHAPDMIGVKKDGGNPTSRKIDQLFNSGVLKRVSNKGKRTEVRKAGGEKTEQNSRLNGAQLTR